MKAGRWMIAVSVFSLIVGQTSAEPAPKPRTEVSGAVYAGLENFNWKEFEGGDELLEEDGPLFLAGGFLEIGPKQGIGIKGLAEVYGGTIDYDGSTWEGVPVSSDTSYSGVKGEGTLGLGVQGKQGLYGKPFVGLGLNFWSRELDTDEEGDQGNLGYDESWSTLYGLAGVAGSLEMNEKAKLFGQIALHLPLYNHVEYDFSNIGGDDRVEVEPDKDFGFLLEAGLVYSSFRIALFYQEMNFGKSDEERVGLETVVWQPESEARIVGLTAGIAF